MHSLPFMSLFTRSASAVAVSPLGLPLAATTWANLTTISPLSQEAKAAEVMDTVRAAAAAAANSWVFIGGSSQNFFVGTAETCCPGTVTLPILQQWPCQPAAPRPVRLSSC